MPQLCGWKLACAVSLGFIVATIAISAQTFTTVAILPPNAHNPTGTLVQGTDGNFYGLSGTGGANQSFCADGQGCGTVFKVAPTGTVTIIHTFCIHTPCADGYGPVGSLFRGGDGNFYGVTQFGGTHSSTANLCANGCGTVFKITTSGTLTTLYSFCALTNCADGFSPNSIMQAFNGGSIYGQFFGTTTGGGANDAGTVFKMSPQGQLTTLSSFNSNSWIAGQLIQTVGANFYGADFGGTDADNCLGGNCGAIFRMTPAGVVTNLLTFDTPTQPISPLVEGADGSFYGMTEVGGNRIGGCDTYGCGTVFKITATGQFTTLHSFCALADCTDGSEPNDGLILATDGNFYGTTDGNGGGCEDKGDSCPGTLFVMTPSGALTTLYTFCAQANCADGSGSGEALVQGTNGKFYGTTFSGETGTVFSLDAGLAPFVTFLTSVGPVGKAVQILGQRFIGATAVSFNGVSSAFTVKSDTYLTTTVPAGATTGIVTVTTPGGTLSSNVAYLVTK
jgi:uncharacterized repeat protein (TIGR03803 family)